MIALTRAHLRRHAVAYVALFIALGGGAMALPGKKVIDKNDLKKSVVKTKNIKKGAVTDAKLSPNASIARAFGKIEYTGSAPSVVAGKGIESAVEHPAGSGVCIDTSKPVTTAVASSVIAGTFATVAVPPVDSPALDCPAGTDVQISLHNHTGSPVSSSLFFIAY